MSVLSDVRLPVQALIDYWGRLHPPHERSACICTLGGKCGSIESLAATVQTSRSTMFRRIGEGTITMAEADQWAGRLGVHPNHIWPGFDRAPVIAALAPRQGHTTGRLF